MAVSVWDKFNWFGFMNVRYSNILMLICVIIIIWFIYLQPYVDTRSGDVDTWPAHASGQAGASTTLMLSKNKSLILYDEEAMGKPKMIPKPRFLEQLESYLKKELRALGVTDVNANELRLQVHDLIILSQKLTYMYMYM